jgi:small subunit ribosomal protein S16
MALAIRLARGGRKNRPHYAVVVTDKRQPRDGRFIEKVGTYNPLLAKDDAARVVLNAERVKYWLDQGAIASDRVAIFLGKAGIAPAPAQKNNPKKALPSDKTKLMMAEREQKKADAAEAKAAADAEAKAAASAAAAAPAEEAPAEAPAEEPAAE